MSAQQRHPAFPLSSGYPERSRLCFRHVELLSRSAPTPAFRPQLRRNRFTVLPPSWTLGPSVLELHVERDSPWFVYYLPPWAPVSATTSRAGRKHALSLV